MDSQQGRSHDLIWAAVITLFAAGALFGTGLARLADGEVTSAAFNCLLGAALAWASSLSSCSSGE